MSLFVAVVNLEAFGGSGQKSSASLCWPHDGGSKTAMRGPFTGCSLCLETPRRDLFKLCVGSYVPAGTVCNGVVRWVRPAQGLARAIGLPPKG